MRSVYTDISFSSPRKIQKTSLNVIIYILAAIICFNFIVQSLNKTLIIITCQKVTWTLYYFKGCFVHHGLITFCRPFLHVIINRHGSLFNAACRDGPPHKISTLPPQFSMLVRWCSLSYGTCSIFKCGAMFSLFSFETTLNICGLPGCVPQSWQLLFQLCTLLHINRLWK
jgi:hypothetical protein